MKLSVTRSESGVELSEFSFDTEEEELSFEYVDEFHPTGGHPLWTVYNGSQEIGDFEALKDKVPEKIRELIEAKKESNPDFELD